MQKKILQTAQSMGRKETMGVQASLNGPVDKAAVTKTAALESGIVHKTNCGAPKDILRFLFNERKNAFIIGTAWFVNSPYIIGGVKDA